MEMPAGGIISHLTAKCDDNVHEEAPVDLLGLPSVGSMTSARNAAVFFGSVAKNPDPTKQKSYGYLTGGGLQPRNVDFARCSGIFRMRGGSSPSEDSLKVAVPGKFVVVPDGAHRIAVDFAEDCQGSVESFFASSG
jgi:hypothetical protein